MTTCSVTANVQAAAAVANAAAAAPEGVNLFPSQGMLLREAQPVQQGQQLVPLPPHESRQCEPHPPCDYRPPCLLRERARPRNQHACDRVNQQNARY